MTLADTAAVLAALKAAKSGDTVFLDPAVPYARLGLDKLVFAAPGVTIASADPGRRASVAGVEMAGCDGITFRDLEVTINARTQTVFNVGTSKNIRLERIDMHGAAGGSLGGLMFRSSSNVSAVECEFHDIGTAVLIIDSAVVGVSGSRFHDIRGDGIQSSGTSAVTLDGNHFTDFRTKPGDHPDAIQFFTLNQKVAARGLTISNNVVERGKGDIVQGIFLGDEAKLGYDDVTIVENAILGGMWNGIAVANGRNLKIADNLVQAGEEMNSWIAVNGSTNATVQGNWATSLLKNGSNAGLVESGNVIIAAAKPGATLMAAWTSEKADAVAEDLIAAAEAKVGVLQEQLDTTMADLGAARGEAKAARATLAVVAADRDEDRAAMADAQERLAAALATYPTAA